MLPLYDHNPGRSVPWATWSIGALCFGVFVLQWSGAVGIGGAFVPARSLDPDHVPSWVTHQFLHGSWAHLIGNLLYLFLFGNNVEDRFGGARFVFFYLFCGLFAAGAQTLGDRNADIPMVGASGAIAGVMGAYLVLFPKVRVQTLIGMRLIALPAWVLLGFWFVWQLLLSAPTVGAGSMGGGGVAYLAHAGGFVAGLVLVKIFDRGGKRF